MSTGIRWKLRSGAPWRTCYARFVPWQQDGTWDRRLVQVQTKDDAVGEVIWEVRIDSVLVRAHQHAAGARRRARPTKKGVTHLADEALGHSRGGLTTKLQLSCDGKGCP